MTDSYILIGQTPVPEPDLLTWARWFREERESRIVKQTVVLDLCLVSTVFLALDHGFGRFMGGGGPPILFETMVFWGGDSEEQVRCATWDQAERQHAAMVRQVARPGSVLRFVGRWMRQWWQDAVRDWGRSWRGLRGIPASEWEAVADRMRESLGEW